MEGNSKIHKQGPKKFVKEFFFMSELLHKEEGKKTMHSVSVHFSSNHVP